MSRKQLDEIDHRILNVLQGDARVSFSKIAGIVGMTHTPVMERIRKMEEAGFIIHHITVLDRTMIGKPVLVILSLKVNPQNGKILKAFEAVMKTLPEVQQMWTVSGNWNFVLHVTAKAPQDYFIFLMEKISILPYVGQTESAFVLRDSKTYTPYIL